MVPEPEKRGDCRKRCSVGQIKRGGRDDGDPVRTQQVGRAFADSMTIQREALETRVLSGLRNQLLHPGFIAEFAHAYQEEFNRLIGHTQKGQDHVGA